MQQTTVVKRINCVCGKVVEGKDDDELWDRAQAHLAAAGSGSENCSASPPGGSARAHEVRLQNGDCTTEIFQ